MRSGFNPDTNHPSHSELKFGEPFGAVKRQSGRTTQRAQAPKLGRFSVVGPLRGPLALLM